jgi:hypothetical protein
MHSEKPFAVVLVLAAMAAPCLAAETVSAQCGLMKEDAARIHADNERMHEARAQANDPEWCASARDLVHAEGDMISIIRRDASKCQVTDERLETLETTRTKIMAAVSEAPCVAKAGSNSNQCASLRADWRAIHANVEIIHEEAGSRFSYSGWCGNARNLIRAADHIISVVTHDPSKCRWTSDSLATIEAWKDKLAPHTEGCP